MVEEVDKKYESAKFDEMPKAFTLLKENSFVEPNFDDLRDNYSANESPIREPTKYTSPEIKEVFRSKSENEEKV